MQMDKEKQHRKTYSQLSLLFSLKILLEYKVTLRQKYCLFITYFCVLDVIFVFLPWFYFTVFNMFNKISKLTSISSIHASAKLKCLFDVITLTLHSGVINGYCSRHTARWLWVWFPGGLCMSSLWVPTGRDPGVQEEVGLQNKCNLGKKKKITSHSCC